MAGNLRTKPHCARAEAESVVRRLREAGHVAYFAGGCVRDHLLGLESKDFDVVTDAPPGRVRELFSNTQAVGAAFGVILVRLRGSQIEVATFRTEGRYLDGRRPESVEFTDAEHDARRRDFTINGLFMDPATNRIIDFVGGQADLAAGRLRAIGEPDERFAEDHLRLLRAVRFAARFDLVVDPATEAAIRRHTPRLARISPERIADELRMMLTPNWRARAWLMLWDFALVDVVMRFLPISSERPPFQASKSFFVTVCPGQPISFALALAAGAACYILHGTRSTDLRTVVEPGCVEQVVRALRTSLKISNEESDEIGQTLSSIEPMLMAEPPGVAKIKRFMARPHAQQSMDVLEAAAVLLGESERVGWLRGRFEALSQGSAIAPDPLITGDDLTAAGYAPGPAFRRVLEVVYDAQLEDRVVSREAAMELAETVFAAAEGSM